jgi:mRNA interferase MazF
LTTKRALPFSKLPAHGEIWQVDFNPVKGDEIMKIRPAVVISSDTFRPLKVKIVVPLTSWQEKFRDSHWMVKINANGNNGLAHDSAADALQLRCVSYERFTRKLGTVSADEIDEIKAAVAIVSELK